MYESINDTLRETFYHNPAVENMLAYTELQVLNNEISSFSSRQTDDGLVLGEPVSYQKKTNRTQKTQIVLVSA